MKFASILWRVALAALLCTVAWFAGQAGIYGADWTERQIRREAEKTRVAVERQIEREAEKTRAAAIAEIDITRAQFLGEAASLRKDVMHQADATRTESLAAIAAIAASADARLVDATTKVDAQLTGFRASTETTIMHLESITAHADEASAILLRRDALPAQLLGVTAAAKVTLGETAQTMRTVRDITAQEGPATAIAVREAAQQANGIATDVHTFTTAATAPVPWYRKVASILYGGATLAARIR